MLEEQERSHKYINYQTSTMDIKQIQTLNMDIKQSTNYRYQDFNQYNIDGNN